MITRYLEKDYDLVMFITTASTTVLLTAMSATMFTAMLRSIMGLSVLMWLSTALFIAMRCCLRSATLMMPVIRIIMGIDMLGCMVRMRIALNHHFAVSIGRNVGSSIIRRYSAIIRRGITYIANATRKTCS